MSSTISSSTSQASLASALLAMTQQSQPTTDTSDSNLLTGIDDSAASDADSLDLSNSSLSTLEASAEAIATQNKNSVIATSEAALAANLAAVSALFSNPTTAQSSQSAPDASQVLKLIAS